MKIRTPRRLVSLAAGAYLMLLAGGLLAPSAARAGCTHYVSAHGQNPRAGFSALNDLDLLSDAVPHRVDVPPKAPSPCAGLTCSRNPMPPLAPAPAGPAHADVWACLAARYGLVAAPGIAFVEAGPTRDPIHSGFPPERPPRAV